MNECIPDAACSCGRAVVESSCCLVVTPGVKCPVGVCRACGRTWRRVQALPLVADGAGTRDRERTPDLTPLRERATP